MSKIKNFQKKSWFLIKDELQLLKMAIFGVEVINSKVILKKKADEKEIETDIPEPTYEEKVNNYWQELQDLPYSEPRPGARISFGGWRPPKNSIQEKKKIE